MAQPDRHRPKVWRAYRETFRQLGPVRTATIRTSGGYRPTAEIRSRGSAITISRAIFESWRRRGWIRYDGQASGCGKISTVVSPRQTDPPEIDPGPPVDDF